MKRAMLAAAALVLSAGVASAAPGYGKKGFGPGWEGYGYGHGYGYSKVTPRERAVIASARAHLHAVKARAWRDGRLTSFERYQIRAAENRLQRVIFRARYS